MDRDPRSPLAANQPVQVTVLGANETRSMGLVSASSRDSVELLIDTPAPPGAAVKIERNETLLLGEVRFCRPEGSLFTIGVELRHALYNTHELARLAKSLLHRL